MLFIYDSIITLVSFLIYKEWLLKSFKVSGWRKQVAVNHSEIFFSNTLKYYHFNYAKKSYAFTVIFSLDRVEMYVLVTGICYKMT